MKKIKTLILLFFGISTFSFAQNCNCESNFQWVKKTFEENDAGFQYIINKKGQTAYNTHNSEILDKIIKAKSDIECTQIIYQWLKFFRSGHFSISLNESKNSLQDSNNLPVEIPKNWETEKVDLKKFEKYINSKKELDLEGIWEYGSYKIGIKKINEEYKGFIIKSDVIEWKLNEVKFKISNDLKSGTFYMRNKTSEDLKKIEIYGKNYLLLNDVMLKRVSPIYETEKEIVDFLKSQSSQKPYLEQLNNSTIFLRIPSFNGSEKSTIDSVLIANKNKLESTENLIIDLRNNGGGSDHSYSELIPYLYTNPIREVRVELYSTKLNNSRMLKFYENYKKYGFSEEQREDFKYAYDILEKNLGKFVMLQGGGDGKIVSEQKLDKVLPFPKNVGIIINNGNGSTTEQFLLAAKQSKKVKLFGTTTMGVLDISNLNFVDSPCKKFKLGYSISKSLRIPDMAIDEKGIMPDYYIDKSIPEHKWVSFVSEILNEK